MVIDKRSQRYFEINSYPKRKLSGSTLITKYLRDASSTSLKALQGQNRLAARSTGVYVREASSRNKNNLSGKNKSITEKNDTVTTTNVVTNSETMRTNHSEIKIKQEQIEDGINKQESKRNKTREFLDDSEENMVVLNSSSEDDSDHSSQGLDTGTAPNTQKVAVMKRPWNTKGSRKKLKQYYSDVKAFATTTLPTENKSIGELEIDDDLKQTGHGQQQSNVKLGMQASMSEENSETASVNDETTDDSSTVDTDMAMEEANVTSSTTYDSDMDTVNPKDTGNTPYDTEMIESLDRTENHDAQADHRVLPKEQVEQIVDKFTDKSQFTQMVIEGDKTITQKKGRAKTVSFTDHTYDYADPLNARKISMKRIQTKNGNSSLTVVAKSQAAIKEQMAQRGTGMVESEKFEVTAIKIEFNIGAQVREYNARAQFIRLMELIKKQDKRFKVQPSQTNHPGWKELDKLPEDDEFVETFNLLTREFRTHKKVILHCKVISDKSFNSIKYSPTVKQYIFEQNIWIKIDRYDSKAEGSPGFFTMIHPRMVQRDLLLTEIRNKLMHNISTESNTNTWDRQKINTQNDDHHQENQYGIVPDFHLEVSQKKWGTLKTEVIRVNCALEHAETLKKLLVAYSDSNKKNNGVFIPVGIHLMTSPETLTNILATHEQFVKNVRGVPIHGIMEEHMFADFRQTKKTVKDTILSIDGVNRVETTRNTSTEGRWIILTDIDREKNVKKSLIDLFKQDKQNDNIFDAVGIGSRKDNINSVENNEISTYADALKTQFTPAMETKGTHEPTMTKMDRYVRAQEAKRLITKLQDKVNYNKNLGNQTKHVESAVISRVTSMEDKWKKIETRLEQLQSDVTETKQKTLADRTSQDNRLHQETMIKRIDEKIEEIKNEQKKEIQLVEQSILKQVDKKIDSKADRISVEVGNHVVERLMELMQPKLDTNPLCGQVNHSTITQDGISSPPTPKTNWNARTSVNERAQEEEKKSNTAKMMTALADIKIQHKRNSHHDNLQGKDDHSNNE